MRRLKRKSILDLIFFVLPASLGWLFIHLELIKIEENNRTATITELLVLWVGWVVAYPEIRKRVLEKWWPSIWDPDVVEKERPDFPYESHSPSELPSRLKNLSHGDIPYIQRLPAAEYQRMLETMSHSQRLLIVGRAGLGKTREAVELIRRIETECGEEASVLVPDGPIEVPLTIPIDKLKRNVILFIDDLPSRYAEQYHPADLSDPKLIVKDSRRRFEDAIGRLTDAYGQKFRVIATAIREPEHLAKLKLQDPIWRSFEVYELPDLGSQQRLDALDVMASNFQIQITGEAKTEAANRSDGTFGGLITPLVTERSEGKVAICADDARGYGWMYPHDWNKRVYPQAIEPNRYKRAVFAALSLLGQANMTPFGFLVIGLAARLTGDQIPPWLTKRRVKWAIGQLVDYLTVEYEIILCEEAYLAGKVDLAADIDQLLAAVFSALDKPGTLVRFLTHKQPYWIPLRPSLYQLMDTLFIELDDPHNAIQVNKWLLDRNPRNARAWTRLAETYLAIDEYEEAEKASQESIHLADHHNAWITVFVYQPEGLVDSAPRRFRWTKAYLSATVE